MVPKLHTVLQMRTHQCVVDWDSPFPQMAAVPGLMHPRIQLAFLAHCWLIFNLLSSKTSESLSASLLPIVSSPSLYV